MICLYPGTFCPPHEGHLAIVRRLAEMFSVVYIICSVNPEKSGQVLFTPEECKQFWRCYDLPDNVELFTLAELMATSTGARMVEQVEEALLSRVSTSRDSELERVASQVSSRTFLEPRQVARRAHATAHARIEAR